MGFALPIGVGLAYVLLSRVALQMQRQALGRWCFALLNIAAVSVLWHWTVGRQAGAAAVRTAIYVAAVAAHYGLLRRLKASPQNASWPAVLYPIFLLVIFKYAQPIWGPLATSRGISAELIHARLLSVFVGLSYMAFRLSHLAVEVRSGVARMPTLAEHLAFAFFVPTMAVGPISPGSVFLGSLDSPSRDATPLGRAATRILVGATKYLFLGGCLAHLTYADLLDDGHPHGAVDWLVSAVAYYIYLYFNFSGMAGVLGISVIENFRDPLLARNIKDFWARWHISLSNYVREMLFVPLSKALARPMSAAHVNHAIAIALFVTFVVTGVWHGTGVNFLLFGVLHGGAFVAHHYYTLALRKRLSRDQFRRYNESGAVHAAAVALTFSFVTATFFVFANDMQALGRIVHGTRTLPERRLFEDLETGQN
jgi:D-alanyl-lipoteichoic acid acyltransferase DltB (MBOAT superfamily)